MVRLHQQQPGTSKLKIENLKLKIIADSGQLGAGSHVLSTSRYLLPATCYLLFLLVLTSCSSPQGKKYRDVNFTAQCNPLFENQLYPSLILALNHTATQTSSQSDTQSVRLYPLTLQVTAPTNDAVLRVDIDSTALNYVTIFQEILPKKGETYTFHPSVKWKYDRLRNLHQPLAIDLTLTCYINDEETAIKNIHLTARSVNECPLSFKSTQVVDTRWLFAAFVNEDHSAIPDILSDILAQGIITRLQGYQTGKAKDVTEQVFAVWYYALDRGIAYSSISCTSNPSTNTNVQHIRFFDQVLTTRQANCIDACVFFASILRKIGLRPVIVVEPCHAYLGYYTDAKRKNLQLLETTITAWVNFPKLQQSLQEDGTLPEEQFQTLTRYLTKKQIQDYRDGKMTFEQVKIAVARSLFDKASEYNRETYDANRALFADPNTISYQILDIEKLRQIVQPI